MKHQQNLENKKIVLGKDAGWLNYGDDKPRVMPAGTVMKLIAYRPEGYQATDENGTFFFLFRNDIEAATEL